MVIKSLKKKQSFIKFYQTNVLIYQYIKICCYLPKPYTESSGVPQDSALGLLKFLISSIPYLAVGRIHLIYYLRTI